MIQVLGGLGNAGFSLNRLLQRADCGVWGDFEGEEICIIQLWGCDIESDAPLQKISA